VSHDSEPAAPRFEAEPPPAAARAGTWGDAGDSELGALSIASAATIILLGNVTSRLLGLVREQVMAWLFGATGGTDAFVVAAAVPTMVYDLLVGGAITAALVPVFVDYAAPEQAARLWRVVSVVFNLTALALGAVVLILIALAPWVIQVLGAGFAPGQQAQTVLMTRVLLLAVVLQGLAGVAMAVLYARQRFALPAFAVAVYNGGIIVGALALHQWLGVTSLVVGVLLGAFGQLALQAPGLRGMVYRPVLDLHLPEIRAIIRLYAPVAAGMVVTIAGIVIDRNLASHLEPGSITVMGYATRLIQFPLGLVATAVGYAVLPTLARYASEEREGRPGSSQGYRSTLLLGVRLVLLLMLPAMVGLIVLREPLIRLLFERGAFNPADTARTAATFLAYAPQLPFTALDQLLIFAFYARKDTRTPVLIGVLGVGVYLATALALLGPWRVVGLATANAVQNSVHGIVLFALLQRRIGGLVNPALASFVGRALAAALGMGGALVLAHGAWARLLPAGGTLALGLELVVLLGLGAAVYLALAETFGLRESRMLWRLARARLSRPRGHVEEGPHAVPGIPEA